MSRLEVDRAMVRIVPETLETDVPGGNEKLYAACDGRRELVPCPVVLPGRGRDVAGEAEQVDAAIRHGAGAVWIRPAQDYWSLEDWASGALFEAAEARRMPVLCLERMVGQDQAARLARRHPAMPVVLAETNYRAQRTLLPLLETFANIYVSIGNNYAVHGGVEQLVEAVGAERILFGSGFPEVEIASAITMLLYSDVPEDRKRLMGSGNMERLMEEIRR